MSLAETLTDILDRSRNGTLISKGGLRDLDRDLPIHRAEAICEELDETLLPRRLTFRAGDGAELVVHAGGRRLLKVVTVKPGDLAGDDAFSERDDKQIAQQNQAIGDLVGRFAALSGGLTVQSAPPDRHYAAGAIGFMPDKIMDVARKRAASLTVAKPKAEAPVVEAPAPDMPPAAAKKLDPTAAMKAMIRDKAAAPTAPKPAPAAPVIVSGKKTMAVVPPGSASDEQVRAFFNEVGPMVDFCAILNADGNIEAASGQLEDEGLLNFAGQIVRDMNRWRGLTHEVLSRSQIIVMRAGGIQNQSLAYFADDYGVAIAVFANTDLSRVFQVANKVLKTGSSD